MDAEFHYYVTYLIAIGAGFAPYDAYRLAYSSQYVDDNRDSIVVYNSNRDKIVYTNLVTQNYNPLGQDAHTDKIYQAFHFLPGDMQKSSNRNDGRKHSLNTTPYSKLAKRAIRLSLKSNDIYWIGIASHAFVDTWAHQNFIGAKDSFNSLSGFFELIIPSIGHSDVTTKPDRLGVKWKDARLIHPVINNNERFLEAADKLLFEYTYHINGKFSYQKKKRFIKDLEEIFKKPRSKERSLEYNLLSIKYSGLDIRKYEKNKWLSDALKKVRSHYHWRNKEKYQLYDWYRFQEAAKRHFSYFTNCV